MNYITVQDLIYFQHKHIDMNDSAEVAEVQNYCDAGMEAVAQYLQYDPELKEYETTEWGDNGKLFAFESYPITEITSAKCMDQTVDVSAFRFGKKKEYIEFTDRSLFNSFNLYSFTYKAGYESVPAEIKTVALQIASLYWESAGGNLAVSSTSFADTGSRVFNNFEKDRYLKALVNYRLASV